MKYGFAGAALVLFVLVSSPVEAQLFRPLTSFRVIQTEYFDIIFPDESERSARHLATFADRTYEQLSAMLGIELRGRLPITFAPHTAMFNGYYRSMPGSHIVLFDTPKDVEWTVFENNLKGLFVHELVHAISLNTRGPFFRVMHRIFGNWVTPSLITAPAFMVEGVAVSFESLGGFGRANDPRTRQYLRQDIHEGRLLTPFQASGLYDNPRHGSYYDYGGLFSAWLQETYGMEKYAELWRAMGRQFGRFSFFVYRSGFYSIFRRVYGINFIDAWNAFAASLALDDLETNDDEVLPARFRFFSERRHFIQGLAACEYRLYFIDKGKDRRENTVRIYDTRTGEISSFRAGLLSYDIGVSADGSTLLVSGYRLLPSQGTIASRYTAVVTEYRADGSRTGRSIRGLYRARYFRDGVIGLRANLHNNNVVFEDFSGNSKVLLHGNERLMFSAPQPVDNERIAVVVSRNGKRELWLYNYVSEELFRIEADNNEYWLYMRGLGVSGGRLFFSHYADDRMSRLGVIDLETMQAVFSRRDFSGGVFNPVAVGSTIYYLGAFTNGSGLLRFPEALGDLTGERSDVRLIPLISQSYQTSLRSASQCHGAGCDLLRNIAKQTPLYLGDSRRYFALRYMNPFQFWLPLPLFREHNNNLRLDGVGILSMISDPTDRNFVTIIAYADTYYQMARIDLLSWENTSLGLPLAVSFFDRVAGHADNPYRETGGTLGSTFFWSAGQWIHGFSLGGGFLRSADYEDGKGAYEWEEREKDFFLFTGLRLSNRRLMMQLNAISLANNFEPRIDGLFRANTNTRFPLHLTLFGAYDGRGMDLHGRSNIYGDPLITDFVLKEYAHPAGLDLLWLGGAELGLEIFSFEIQRNLSHLYVNRLSGIVSIRNQIYDSGGLLGAEGIEVNDFHLIQSLAFRIGLKTSFLPVVRFPVSIEPHILCAWKFSNAITGQGPLWHISAGLSVVF
ncbi:MAG: hypothetical protein FWC36_07140 [Spirochaetes bacterium]|nr:hypothetical protein [Spirochaetota bacterium]